MKDILAQETMLTYPELDKLFVIYTDASKRQIGGIITQNETPCKDWVLYYSRVLL